MVRSLRDTIKNTSGVLKGLFVLGTILIIIGILHFTGLIEHDFSTRYGISIPDNSLWGITYQTLYAFGFLFIFVSLLLLLPIMDQKSRLSMEKLTPLWGLLIIIGIGFIVYSVLIYMNWLLVLDSNHSWFDYYMLGGILTFIGFVVLIFSPENFNDMIKYYSAYKGIFFLGVFIEILSFLSYSKLLLTFGILKTQWIVLCVIGIIPLFIGGIPLLLISIQNSLIKKILIIITSLLGLIIGGITYLAPTLALNKIIFPMSVFKYNNYFDYLVFGSLLFIGSLLWIKINFKGKFLKRNTIWGLFLILGFINILVSSMLVISDTYFIDLGITPFLENKSTLAGYSILGMTWDVYFFNGIFIIIIAIIIITSNLFIETLEVDSLKVNF